MTPNGLTTWLTPERFWILWCLSVLWVAAVVSASVFFRPLVSTTYLCRFVPANKARRLLCVPGMNLRRLTGASGEYPRIAARICRRTSAPMSAALLAIACAGATRDTETRVDCTRSGECVTYDSGACAEAHCAPTGMDAGNGGGGGASGASAVRASGGTGGGPSTGGTNGGRASTGAGGATGKEGGTPSAALCIAGDSLSGPEGGFAPLYGCHPTKHIGDPDCFKDARECIGPGVHLPSELPCGACMPGDRCTTAIAPLCDCDGDGPSPSFLQDPDGDIGLNDGWACQCEGGSWHCYLQWQSGSSCFLVCGSDGGAAR